MAVLALAASGSSVASRFGHGEFEHGLGHGGLAHEGFGHEGFGHGGGFGGHRNVLGGLHDDILFGELTRRGYDGFGHGGFRRRGLRRGGLGGLGGRGFGHGAGIGGGVGGLGAVGGGFRDSDREFGAVGGSAGLSEAGLAAGSKRGVIANQQHLGGSGFDVDAHNNNNFDDTQVINKNKLIVAEKDTGFKNTRGNSNSDLHATGGSFNEGSSNLIGGEEKGLIAGRKDARGQFGAVGARDRETEAAAGAAGAFGAAGGAGVL